MTQMRLVNRSDRDLSLIIEPVAEIYSIKPGTSVRIEAESTPGGPFDVEYYSSNDVAVWTHALTSVFLDGALLAPR